jgi:hypothetical protein
MVYVIKSREKFNKGFKIDYNNFYKNQELSELLLKPLNISDFISTLRNNISIKDINYFTDNIINQLVCMYPEYELLIKKDKMLDESLYSELSSFCLKEGFVEVFNANVTGCIISKSFEKLTVDISNHMSGASTRELSYSTPSTLLCLDHEIIKKIIIKGASIPVISGTNISFDINLSYKLTDFIENLKYIKVDEPKPHLGASGFEALFAKRKPQEIESLNSKVTLPGNIEYLI